MVTASWWQVKPSTIKKCFEKACFVRDRGTDAPADDDNDERVSVDEVWSDLVRNNVFSETFGDFLGAINADADVCEQAMTDEDIVATVWGDQDEAALEPVPDEYDIDIPDVSCKDALDYLSKQSILRRE